MCRNERREVVLCVGVGVGEDLAVAVGDATQSNTYSPYSSQPVDFDVSKHAQRPSVRLMHPPYEVAFQLISLHNLTHASKTHTSMSEAPPLCIMALLRSPSDGERACCLTGLSTLKIAEKLRLIICAKHGSRCHSLLA